MAGIRLSLKMENKVMKIDNKVYEKCKKSRLLTVLITIISFTVVAYGVVYFTQYLMGVGVAEIEPGKDYLGMLCVLIVFTAIYVVGIRAKWSLIAGTFLILVLTTANYYTYSFRGNEMTPADILAFRTAMSVAGNYQFHFGQNIILPWVLFVIMVIVCIIMPEYRWKSIWKPRVVSFGILLLLTGIFLYTSESHYSISWQNYGTKTNGFIYNFTLQAKELYVEKPEGYDIKEIEQLSTELQSEQIQKENTPDIIMIMNESFSDLSILGQKLNTNQAVTPFIDTLEEDTVKGNLAVSVIGGGTSTSEYEALTGNTHLFLENTSSSYQQYVRKGSYSAVVDLEKMGYKTIGMHPYYASGWNRSSAYDSMGFDETYFLEDFPQENMIRNYVSDQEMYEKVIEEYEKNKNENDQSLFLFGVTMQNHGGYTYEGADFEYSITLDGYENEYRDAQQYLSLIHETDKAIEYLINYFEKEDREVLVVFFGDHQPSLNEAFLTEISDVDYDTAEERLRRYTVPFFIWGNYDIQEKNVGMIGLNYLMNEVYQTAEMTMSPYQQFLSKVREVIPYMNRYAYYSLEKQAFTYWSKAEGKEKEMLDLYWNMEYNNMFDHKHRNEELFPIAK